MVVAAQKDQEALAVSASLTAKYFRALGDPTRLRILELVLEKPHTVSELTRELGCAQSNISNHLACLRWCGFVEADNRGKWAYYSARDPKIRAIIELGRSLVSENAEHVAACVRIADKSSAAFCGVPSAASRRRGRFTLSNTDLMS